MYKTAKELGKKGSHKYFQHSCGMCGKERWVTSVNIKKVRWCLDCFYKRKVGENNPNWKGGKTISNGYYRIKMPNHPFANPQGYVYEHRLIMADLVGTENMIGMEVHHKDGNKLNNDPNNLELMDKSIHRSLHNRRPWSTRRKIGEPNPLIICACGCREERLKYNKKGMPARYIRYHYNRWSNLS